MLKPCPLCGSSASLTHIKDEADTEAAGVRMAVQCTGVGCWLTLEDWRASGVDLLVAQWNERKLIMATDHVAKTCFADRVVYMKDGKVPHVAFVVEVHSDHCATLVYWCHDSKAWYEAASIQFGKRDGCYFVNPEA